MDAREIKARQIVAGGRITRGDGYWLVPSQKTRGARYRVVLDGLYPSCTCDDWETRCAGSATPAQPCKHMLAVQLWIEQGKDKAPAVPATEPSAPLPRKTYKQPWHEYNLAQTREKGHVQALLADLCAGLRPTEPVKRRRGRPEVPLADAVFAVVLKVYGGFSARRSMHDVESAREAGHLSRKVCYNSVLKAMESESLTPVLKDLIGQTALPLSCVESRYAVDSSGFASSCSRRWYDHKYNTERTEHVWVKVHLVTGCLTNCVTAAEILDKDAGDAPQLPGLIDTTAEGFRIGEVSADKAYPSRANFDAVAKHGGTLYAMFKSNTSGSVGGLFEKMFHYFQFRREDFLRHYHQRSNVESTFSGIKRTMGDSVRSKTETAMRNEVYAKLIAWNLTCLVHAIYELGIVPVFWQSEEEREAPRDIIRFPTIA